MFGETSLRFQFANLKVTNIEGRVTPVFHQHEMFWLSDIGWLVVRQPVLQVLGGGKVERRQGVLSDQVELQEEEEEEEEGG